MSSEMRVGSRVQTFKASFDNKKTGNEGKVAEQAGGKASGWKAPSGPIPGPGHDTVPSKPEKPLVQKVRADVPVDAGQFGKSTQGALKGTTLPSPMPGPGHDTLPSPPHKPVIQKIRADVPVDAGQFGKVGSK